MAIIHSDAFTVAVDTFIEDYGDWVDAFGSTENGAVSADRDRFESARAGSDLWAAWNGAGVPTGDQEIRCSVAFSGSFQYIGPAGRITVPQSGYVMSLSTADSRLWRVTSNSFTALDGMGGNQVGDGTIYEAVLKITGTNPVLLTATIDDVVVAEDISDSTASRFESGLPGMQWFSTGVTGGAGQYLDAWSVDDLQVGGGDVELAPHDLAVAASIESPTLVQSHVLTVASMSVGVTVEAPSLSQSYTLSPAGIAVAASVEAPSLTQAHVLAPAGLDVAASLEAPTLTVGGQLAPADLSVAATLEAPSLTQAHVLAPSGLTLATALDTVALTQAHTLAVQSLAVAGALESPTLDFGAILAVADMLVAAALDGPTLTQAHALTVADLLSAASLEAVALTQANVLSPADMAVAALLESLTLELLGELFPAARHTLGPDNHRRILGPDNHRRILGPDNHRRILGPE